jgi:thermostable 8-oxoguanine DNA glycosylase
VVKNKNNFRIIELLILIWYRNLEIIFSYVGIALCVLLCIVITNCSAALSFSTLKRIKDYLGYNTEENRLNSLSLLVIETG